MLCRLLVAVSDWVTAAAIAAVVVVILFAGIELALAGCRA
jgi:hypothetical protein